MHGDIVNVSSLGGLRGMQRFSGFGAYATSKHAVVGLTEALALEGKPHGIRVNAVAPGTMKTAMIESLGVEASTLPDDIAPTVAFLLDRRRSAPIRSEEHTSELQSPMVISYAVFCIKK